MSDLMVLAAMLKKYDEDLMTRTEFGEEIVSSEMLSGERRMIKLVSDLIDRNVSLMGEENARQKDQ